MSKRIRQTVQNGSVRTRTVGSTEGFIANFDVEAFSPASSLKKASELVLQLEGKKPIVLDGRKMKTLRDVLNRHFETLSNEN